MNSVKTSENGDFVTIFGYNISYILIAKNYYCVIWNYIEQSKQNQIYKDFH